MTSATAGCSTQSFATRGRYHDRDYLFDLETDYAQENDLESPELRRRMDQLLSRLLAAHESPPEQFEVRTP